MITGSHSIIYTKDAEADRDFFKNVLQFPFVDVGHGWLIFGLPPSEVAFHPADKNDRHEFYLMCDDINKLIETLKGHKIECSNIHDQPWGFLIYVSLPGGGKLGIYEPKHERPFK